MTDVRRLGLVKAFRRVEAATGGAVTLHVGRSGAEAWVIQMTAEPREVVLPLTEAEAFALGAETILDLREG